MYAFVWVHACVHVVHAGTLIQFTLIYSVVFLYFIQLVSCGYGMLYVSTSSRWMDLV